MTAKSLRAARLEGYLHSSVSVAAVDHLIPGTYETRHLLPPSDDTPFLGPLEYTSDKIVSKPVHLPSEQRELDWQDPLCGFFLARSQHHTPCGLGQFRTRLAQR